MSEARLPARAIAQATGAVLLILIVGVSITGVYLASKELSGEEARDSASRMMFQLSLEEVIPLSDEDAPGTCFGLKAVIRNSGSDPAPLDGLVMYAERGGQTAALLKPIGLKVGSRLPPGSALEVTFVSESRELDDGPIVLRLAGRYSTSDSLSLNLPCRIAPTIFFSVSPLNEAGSPINASLGPVEVRAWTEPVGGQGAFLVKLSITVDETLPPGSLRVELLRGKDLRPLGEGEKLVFRNEVPLAPSGVCVDDEEDEEEARDSDDDDEEGRGGEEGRSRGEGEHSRVGDEHDEDHDDEEECEEGRAIVWSVEGVPPEAFPLIVLVTLLG